MTLSTPTRRPPVRHVLCLDGTWNNPAKEKTTADGDSAYKPTNVLKTARATLDADPALGAITLLANPHDGATIDIDGKRYTFQTDLNDGDGHVRIDPRGPKQTLENLRFAINERSGRNRYGSGTTRHARVRAAKIEREPDRIALFPRGTDRNTPVYEPIRHDLRAALISDRGALAATLRERGYDSRTPVPQSTYYDIGVGGSRKYPGGWNAVHHQADKLAGGARGAGFEANIEDAYTHLCLNYQDGDEIFLFGFSRGAACVRSLVNFIDWMGGLLQSSNAYYVPFFFDHYLTHGGTSSAGSFASAAPVRQQLREQAIAKRIERGASRAEAEAETDELLGSIVDAPIRFVGVWDTVLAIGDRVEHFLRDRPPARAQAIRHALAIDEWRDDFTPHIWSGPSPGQSLAQRWFAGVHTDVGGGYPTFTLSNTPLRWVLEGAQHAGLGLDWSFLANYVENPKACQHESKSLKWKLKDLSWFRRQKGVRRIEVGREGTLDVHSSALQRLAIGDVTVCDGEDRATPMRYRPANLLDTLAALPDLSALLDARGLGEEERQAVLSAVAEHSG